MNTLLDMPRFFEDLLSKFPTPSFAPALDVYEDKDNWILHLEVPGLSQKDLKIEVEGDVLSIRGEKKSLDEGRTVHSTERRWGEFAREVAIPENADADKATASCKDGVLTVTLPKKPETKPRSISIDVK